MRRAVAGIFLVSLTLFGCNSSQRDQPLAGYTLTVIPFDRMLLTAKPCQVENTLLLVTTPDFKPSTPEVHSYIYGDSVLTQGHRWPKLTKVLVTEESVVFNEEGNPPAKRMLFMTHGEPDRTYNLEKLQVNPYWHKLVFGSVIVAYEFRPKTGELTLCRMEGDSGERLTRARVNCLLLGFTAKGHTLRWVTTDGKCEQLSLANGLPEPCPWDATIVSELAQLPPGRGAFTETSAVYRSAETTDRFLHIVDAERTQGLVLVDAFSQDPQGRSIRESQGNYYVDHPEALAQVGKRAGPAVNSNGTQVWPLSAREVVLVDKDYNRIVLLTPST